MKENSSVADRLKEKLTAILKRINVSFNKVNHTQLGNSEENKRKNL